MNMSFLNVLPLTQRYVSSMLRSEVNTPSKILIKTSNAVEYRVTMDKFHLNEHKKDTLKCDWLISHIISITLWLGT